MSVLLMTIATGEAYRNYAIEMLASANEFWPGASTLVFTDFPQQMQAYSRALHTDPKGYPNETLFRYSTFLKAKHVLGWWDHVFYVDADMKFVAPVGDVLSDGLVATLHPGFAALKPKGTTEDNPKSYAFCPHNTKYFCGGFQGGNTQQYLKAVEELAIDVQLDYKRGIIARWHDESYWNRYLADNPPSKILSPSYCYPEDYNGEFLWTANQYPPILVALDKRKRGNHPRPK